MPERTPIGAIGGVLRATSGAPKFSTVSSVKNPALQGNIDTAINQYGGVNRDIQGALGDYISRYMGQRGAAEGRTGQEIGAINQFYNGQMGNQLAQLRSQRTAALENAANVASKQAIAAQNRSRVAGGGGGGGSYDTRLAMANLTPIRAQAAVDEANQARSDLGYVTQNQLGLTGQRNALAASQAAYGLVPQAQRLQLMGQQAGYLGQLSNLDQANKFYGLQQKPNMWADVADSLDQGILNAASIYSSIGTPGMGGGKARGGEVHGPGTETSDSIPARLSDGEYVIPAEAMEIPGMKEHLDHIRRLALIHREMKKTEHPMRMGGMVRYSDGGEVLHYADGGLAASAQQLGARAMADLSPTWMPATLVGAGASAPAGMGLDQDGGFGGLGGGRGRFNAMTGAGGPGAVPPSRYFSPSNYGDLTQQWQGYGNYWSNYYNNPKSPGYVAPGTYE